MKTHSYNTPEKLRHCELSSIVRIYTVLPYKHKRTSVWHLPRRLEQNARWHPNQLQAQEVTSVHSGRTRDDRWYNDFESGCEWRKRKRQRYARQMSSEDRVRATCSSARSFCRACRIRCHKIGARAMRNDDRFIYEFVISYNVFSARGVRTRFDLYRRV